ncbi:MAG: carbamoyltransferase [Pseudomonadota bacterium]|nr:carbamoyltransferase [Pseudomonadota bacterium]
MSIHILGLSAYYHDSAAALLRDGVLVAAAQEERFTRKKHDPVFPARATSYCLTQAGITLDQVDQVVFYDKPLLKFDRLLETFLTQAPRGLRSFLAAMPVWLSEKLYLKTLLRRALRDLLPEGASGPKPDLPPLLFTEHHQAHAGSAFYPSPFERAAILCLDGVGEWATTSVWRGIGGEIEPLWQLDFPHSLGLLYSAFTYFTGFKVNSGEYKLMGLAPYGEPRYRQRILDELLDLKSDGTFRLNLDYFGYLTGLRMTNRRFARLFDGPARTPESPITRREMDIACSIQRVTEEIVLRLARTVHRETGESRLCLAGGVALNCVANGRLLREGPFDELWIQPAAGDAGGALGAAFCAWHLYLQNDRSTPPAGAAGRDAMSGAYLGPEFTPGTIKQALAQPGAVIHELDDDSLFAAVAERLAAGKVIGWFQGRMEFGPRALGNRSILGDPRDRRMQSTMNLKIKYRESFRPFAPAVLEEHVADWFEITVPSPYMLLVADIAPRHRTPLENPAAPGVGIELLKQPRSTLPAVTHVDYSARIQTVSRETNPRFHRLISAFYDRTGCPAVVNTSFNVRGEPIVHTPADAYRCFIQTEMDCLVVGNCLLDKAEQPPVPRDPRWLQQFEPD